MGIVIIFILRSIVINNAIKREFIEKIPPLYELFRPYRIINGFYEENGEFWYQSHLSTIIIKDFVRHFLSFIFLLAPFAIMNSLNTSIYYGGIICSKIVLNQLNNVEKPRLFELLCIMDTGPIVPTNQRKKRTILEHDFIEIIRLKIRIF